MSARNTELGMRALLLTALALGLSAGPLHAQPGYKASVSTDRSKLRLWESARVTLTVEGPAPVHGTVGLAEQVLDDEANKNWRIRPKGAPEVHPVPGAKGRERWQQAFRLDPIDLAPAALGKPIKVAFAPVRVNGKPLDQPLAVELTVERTGKADDPLPESLPVTTVEELPVAPTKPAERSWLAISVSAAVALVCAALVVSAWRRARRPKPVPAGTWARAALAELEAEHLGGPNVAERVAGILRLYIERRFGLPATRLTTAELSEVTAAHGWPAGDARSLRGLLDACDLAKFAGTVPDFEGCARLIETAREWLDRVDQPAPGA